MVYNINKMNELDQGLVKKGLCPWCLGDLKENETPDSAYCERCYDLFEED